MKCKSGELFVHDLEVGFGYVSQLPWMQRGTIRDNILWGAVYEESRYKSVLYACALIEDLEDLGGDHTGVGEAGHTLSGGQRARIALARAVYQDKQIYLLDNILSALDAHVTNHIIKHCILGILKNKTRIIVSENRSLLIHATQIFNISNGNVRQSELMSHSDISDDDMLSNSDIDRMTNIKLNNDNDDNLSDDTRSINSILMDETKEHGKLSTSIFISYLKAMTLPLAFTVLLSVVLMQVSRNLSDVWLAHWVGSNNITTNNSIINKNVTDHTTNYYLGIYSGLALTNSLLTLIRAFIFAYAGIKAAKYIHKKLLNSVFYVSL